MKGKGKFYWNATDPTYGKIRAPRGVRVMVRGSVSNDPVDPVDLGIDHNDETGTIIHFQAAKINGIEKMYLASKISMKSF